MLNWLKSKPKTVPQRLRSGESVSLDEIKQFISDNYPPEEQDKFYKEVRLKVYPVVVGKLLEFYDKSEVTQQEFFNHLRRITKDAEEDSK